MASRYDTDLVHLAAARWRTLFDKPDVGVLNLCAFGTFIGYPYEGGEKIIDTDDPEVRRIIDLINSNNGDTILRMMDVQRKEKKHAKG